VEENHAKSDVGRATTLAIERCNEICVMARDTSSAGLPTGKVTDLTHSLEWIDRFRVRLTPGIPVGMTSRKRSGDANRDYRVPG
jgi:hypothetical protein